MDDYVKFELDASHHGWACSNCKLFVDCMGRPIFGKPIWVIHCNGVSWIENKPKFKFCPQCGKPVKDGIYHD